MLYYPINMKVFLFIFFTALTQCYQAQMTVVLEGDISPHGLHLNDERIYFCETNDLLNNVALGHFPVGAEDLSIDDVTVLLPENSDVLNCFSYGEHLYYQDVTDHDINRINLNESNSEETLVYSGMFPVFLYFPFDLVVYDSAVFVSNVGTDHILRIDLTDTELSTTVGAGYSDIAGLHLEDSILYIAEDSRISFVNLDQQPFVRQTLVQIPNTYISLIYVRNSILYFIDGEWNISSIDLNQSESEPHFLIQRPSQISGMVVSESDLYLSELVENRIVKFPLNTLNIESINNSFELSLYPNPSDGIINWKYLPNLGILSKIEVLDLFGRVVFATTEVISNNQVDISELPIGTYLFKMNFEKGILVKRFVLQKK